MEEIANAAIKISEILVNGGPRAFIMIGIFNVVFIAIVLRRLAKQIYLHYQYQLDHRDSEIKHLKELVKEKDRILNERFELFQELTSNYMTITKDVAAALKVFEMGVVEIRALINRAVD